MWFHLPKLLIINDFVVTQKTLLMKRHYEELKI
mgnify:CR=1 FL=1